jgi:hypothetical protein
MTNKATRPLGVTGEAIPLADDLLRGANEIAMFIYGTDQDADCRRVYHAASKHGLPTFKLGGVICARKSTILAWIEDQERAA